MSFFELAHLPLELPFDQICIVLVTVSSFLEDEVVPIEESTLDRHVVLINGRTFLRLVVVMEGCRGFLLVFRLFLFVLDQIIFGKLGEVAVAFELFMILVWLLGDKRLE